ncbi:MAG TPA: outer membrane beta-barrel protein [Candidatus Saccharicenans sp.]|nr:outer membrane beta-barrel protein [Candidatus Saccharicenans sp.]HOM94240.1 outer membrane beta-barrel protein [Candidatus Saccharicenans sp.]HQE64436.1 outer membrane beta-barrel protein [Candidatus Saccharicenans sp.]HQH60750.1 outer membrane beta-barrel protein [Candidatus Saccharicenans sp.]HQI22089.1 outer membrane beta-barrel protein [Candidatus Saccharicenans sp.]
MKNLSRLASFILFISIFLLTAGRSFAQSGNWMGNTILNLFQQAPWKLGTVRAYRQFTLGNAGYDSDIYYGYYDTHYPDVSFNATPAFQWFVPLSKLVIFDSYQSLEGVFYFKNENERAFNFVTRNQVHFLSKKFYGKTGLNYSNVRQRFSPELLLHIRQEEISWDGLFLWQFSRSGAIAWQVRGARLNYRQPASDSLSIDRELNRNEYYADAFLYFQPGTRLRLYLNGQLGLYDFRYRESRFKDSRTYAGFGGIEFIPAAGSERTVFEGNFNIGYMYLDLKNRSLKDASNVVGSGNITLNVTRWLSLQADYSRDFNVSIYSSLLHYLQTTYGGGLRFTLSRRVTLSNHLGQGLTKYPFSQEEGLSGPEYKFTTFMTNLGIRISREWQLNIFGTLNQRKIFPEDRQLKRQFIGFNLIFGSIPGENILPIPSLL